MRIIKAGKKPSVEKVVTCGKCKTRFAYNITDIQPDPRDGNYVKCPTCDAFIAAGWQPSPPSGLMDR